MVPILSTSSGHRFGSVILLATFVIGGCSDTPGKKGESAKPVSEILFSHDQQPATNIQGWGRTWLVTSRRVLSPGNYANRFFELDLANMAAKELLLPGKGENLAVATNQQGKQFVLVRCDTGIVLMARGESEWRPISIPIQLVEAQSGFFSVALDGMNILILAERVLWHRHDGEWRRITFPEIGDPEQLPDNRDHVALIDDTLYVGFDRGEWGGALVALDLVQQSWIPASVKSRLDGLPVLGFTRDPTGDLWAVEGLAHRRHRKGALRIFRKGKWVQFAKTFTTLPANKDGSIDDRTTNWGYPPTKFIGLDFDTDGDPYVLTPELGIFRHHNGDWLRVTKQWPDFSYHDSALGGIATNHPNAMAIVDEHTAILTVNDTGVLVYNLDTDEILRIPIPK